MAPRKAPAKAPAKRPAKKAAVTVPTVAERKKELADRLLGDVERLRGQMFSPVTETRAMVVSDGMTGSHVELVDIERDEPTFAEKKLLAQTIAIVLDKALELGGNAATNEGGVIDELAKKRETRRGAAAKAPAAASRRR